ncbi:MAG TPA: ribosome-associated translation inhibitor RaiA [Acidimicrobiales bacterium]|nr:ribosome-associated translation inhibitor RaiA [Acidimicrobiales bacterium]
MEIAIRGRNVDVSDSLKQAVREKLVRLQRFLEGMERAEVRFIEERNPRIADKEICEVTLHGHGHVVRARASAPEILLAVDRVVEKLEHRLARLKGKLLGRSHPRRPLHVNGNSLTAEEEAGEPQIVRTKQFAIKPMTAEEASLQMELLGHSFFLFTDAETSVASVVYRRHDGHVGLIEGT